MTDDAIPMPDEHTRQAPERIPGDFHRTATKAPRVAHPTDRVSVKGKKGDLVKALHEAGVTDDDIAVLAEQAGKKSATVAMLREAWPDILERPKSVVYGRPSGFGENLEDPYALLRWKERKLTMGLLLGGFEVTPGVEVTDADIDRLIQEAYRAAETDIWARRGTHVHLLTEMADSGWDVRGKEAANLIEEGEAIGLPAPLQEHIVDEWRRFREAMGLTALAIEMPVVHDEHRKAGTLDRLDVSDREIDTPFGKVPAGTPFVGDIKTSHDHADDPLAFPEHWVQYPVQIVTYRDGTPYDPDRGAWGERTGWPTRGTAAKPEVMTPHEDVAFIYHYPLRRVMQGEETHSWRMVPVNLERGREGARIAMEAAAFEHTDDRYSEPVICLTPESPPPVPEIEAEPVVVHEAHAEPIGTIATAVSGDGLTVTGHISSDGLPLVFNGEPLDESHLPTLIENLRGRVGWLIEHGHENIMTAYWPADARTLGNDDLTLAEVIAISEAVAKVEREVVGPFDPPPPEAADSLPKPPARPVEGGQANQEHVNNTVAAYQALTDAQRAVVDSWAADADEASRLGSVPIGFGLGGLGNQTLRRVGIARALINCPDSFRMEIELGKVATLEQLRYCDARYPEHLAMRAVLGFLQLGQIAALAESVTPSA